MALFHKHLGKILLGLAAITWTSCGDDSSTGTDTGDDATTSSSSQDGLSSSSQDGSSSSNDPSGSNSKPESFTRNDFVNADSLITASKQFKATTEPCVTTKQYCQTIKGETSSGWRDADKLVTERAKTILDSPEGVAAVILIDMNGLKTVNDAQGHAAGDEALAALALCIKRSLKPGQSGYRLGGDEFAVIGRRSSRGELMELKKRIEVFVGNTGYSCSIGCSFNEGGGRTVKSMLDEADSMMYADKARYYEQSGKDGHRPA